MPDPAELKNPPFIYPKNRLSIHRMTEFNRPGCPSVLLIARDQIMSMYTDEVLKRTGLQIICSSPWQARNLIREGRSAYTVVVFSHTMIDREILEIAMLLRRCQPESKLLRMLSPDSGPFDSRLFDFTLDGLDGPGVLVREVCRLAAETGNSPESKPVAG